MDPERAQYEMDVDEFVRRVEPLKGEFTNGDRTKELCRRFAVDLGVDPERTYFDIPRLRVIPADQFLTAGVSYNYKAHRDMWYGHPQQLVNYWTPVFDVVGDNVMSMYTDYFDRPVKNGSNAYDYDYDLRTINLDDVRAGRGPARHPRGAGPSSLASGR